MEFHISRTARDRYQFDASLFEYSGNVILANFHAARVFAQKMNATRDLTAFPETAVRASQINAMGLLDEIFHHVIQLYREQRWASIFQGAMESLKRELGQDALQKVLLEFTREFPPLAVYQGQMNAEPYLAGQTEGVPNAESALEELILLWVTNVNPACSPYQELFADTHLAETSAYQKAIELLQAFFNAQPKFGPQNQDLISLLRSPAIAVPHSLSGQLDYISTHWNAFLGGYLYRLLTSLDLIREDERARFMGPGPTLIPMYDRRRRSAAGEIDLTALGEEQEAFSPDKEWMPRLVLLAKNVYVWLDQLSRQSAQRLTRLDQIPDAELLELQSRGITGLWLIGLWERSRASARIKQLCGNPEALASAYSLFDYQIAEDLGGESAFQALRAQAARFGIRLASDMVPNHMGIDSRWVVDHPDWFIQSEYPPFPAYQFNGPDLSQESSVSVQVEDHYYSREDAAVVFKYYDHRNGQTRFIYHGNDGTSMPWNDTAQLNYLLPQVREAVIQTILAVARRFPIIRFDAAMTLAKRHYQRLWFPEPGSGGAIPSRAEHAMTRQAFNEAFPQEFWREVVDRVAQETPDTLLLAEAFWLMEGYFVRTLGMHRVYNSAFMNMLRNEENAKYRALIKNTIEFEPEILKRYVNFMNNPDEETAIEQFGKGDKYFGICAMMATIPGLPMLGHGQVEGFTEKYGMEYRRAYRDETPDPYLIERHRREIFPLFQRRHLFAGVENFNLFDFNASHGQLDDNVFAYTNSSGGESALFIFNNAYEQTRGSLRFSTPVFSRQPQAGNVLKTIPLTQALGLPAQQDQFIIARDQISNLEYLFSSADLNDHGMFFALNGYEYHVFLDFRVVQETSAGSYQRLYSTLQGRGVPSVSEALHTLLLQSIQQPFREIANRGYFAYVLSIRDQRVSAPQTSPDIATVTAEANDKLDALLSGIQSAMHLADHWDSIREQLRSDLKVWLEWESALAAHPTRPGSPISAFLADHLHQPTSDQPKPTERMLQNAQAICTIFLKNLGMLSGASAYREISRSWVDEWRLGGEMQQAFQSLGLDEPAAGQAGWMVRVLISIDPFISRLSSEAWQPLIREWLTSEDVRTCLQVNRFQDVLWFNQESFNQLSWWFLTSILLDALRKEAGSALLTETLLLCAEIRDGLDSCLAQSNFQYEKLLACLEE